MKKLYYIQDVETKRYFASYRGEEGFVVDYKEANAFHSDGEIAYQLDNSELFEGMVLTVVEYYLF